LGTNPCVSWMALVLYLLVALLWFVPDRRIESVLVRK
jgi:hypothetical protein